MNIITDLRILKKLERLSNNEWTFDRQYKYFIGNTYTRCKSVKVGNKTYSLKYFSGCFYPYCVEE